tara:strand:+ start:259 stop:960 length:702 start_codon:yes stop_codon:yes gene_type:complete
MALPKLNIPTHRLTLPSTGDEVKFRPFLVKEQKLLLMAQQSDDEKETIDNMIQMIENCTNLNVTNLPVFDVEYLFLKIRAKSVGDIIQLNLLCPDDGITYVNTTLDLNDVEVQIDETHKNIIDITDDVKMIMKYPQISDVQFTEINPNEVSRIFQMLKKCILEVHNGDEIINSIDMKTEEISDFVDSLNTEQFENVMQFFNTMPKVRHVVEVTNPKTGVKSEVLLEGLQSFLE